MARLFASVAPEVKTISWGRAPMSLATLLPGDVHGLGRVPAETMRARGVAVPLREVGPHRVEYAWIGAGRCVIVQVDRASQARGAPSAKESIRQIITRLAG